MIDRKKRGIGVGKLLIRWAEFEAAKNKCTTLYGYIGSQRAESQAIYIREGFLVSGFYFEKNI